MSELLALSDVLIVRALERACARGLTGAQRAALAGRNAPRHRGYEAVHMPVSRHASALQDAWTITPELAATWQLTVDPNEWAAALNGYCRELLTTCQPRSLVALERALIPIGLSRAG